MATTIQKITLSASRDIPFNKLVLSQANVRRVKAGVSIEELAEDIARRTLLQSLSVRAVVDADGNETGMFEVPAGGRRSAHSNGWSSRSAWPRPRRCRASCVTAGSPRRIRWRKMSSAWRCTRSISFALSRHSRGYNKEPYLIRRQLTEGAVRTPDRRALFIGIEAYEAAGGAVMRDLFQHDDGDWLQAPAQLDRLLTEKF